MNDVIPPFDGATVNIAGETYPVVLTLNEIGRFEQAGGEFYGVFHKLYSDNPSIKMADAMMLIKLGLTGAGMSDDKVGKIMQKVTVKDLLQLEYDVKNLMAVTLVPDDADEVDTDEDEDNKKN